MQRYLIEIPHDPEPLACTIAVQLLLKEGSHFVTNADFGCHDGVHKSWLILEAESKDEARHVVPSRFRGVATITCLNRFTMEELDKLYEEHGGKPGSR
jgi:hypothetical protein